jgi:hypothetical protein
MIHFKLKGTGWSKDPEYMAWANAKQRCTNPNNPAWEQYGGRGITMCKEWQTDFKAFLRHIGLRPVPSYSLDRRDNDGNYEPGNVRWASKLMQRHNQRLK